MSSRSEASIPIPNTLTLNDAESGVDSSAAMKLRNAITSAAAFIKASHVSDTSEYFLEAQDMLLCGPVGISYAFMRLAEQAPKIGLASSASSFAASAVSHLERALSRPYMTDDDAHFPSNSTTRHCGQIGWLLRSTGPVIQALCCHFAGLRRCGEAELARLTKELCEELEPGFWVNPLFQGSTEDVGMDSEPLSGRSGFLAGILMLRRYVKEAKQPASEAILQQISDEAIAKMVAKIISSGEAGAKRLAKVCASTPGLENRPLAPLMWAWSANEAISKLFHIGAGHGVIGILSIILESPPTAYEPFHPSLLATIDFLLSIQTASGDLPRTYQGADWERYTVYWCHGAGGFTQFLSLLLKLNAKGALPLGADRKDRVITGLDRSATAVWERGLLRKGPGICHGIGGSAWVLLAASQAPFLPPAIQAKYRSQAISMGVFVTRWQELVEKGEIRLPDTPKSLFEGIAGTMCFWGDLLEIMGGGKGRGFPGMSDSGEV
ncbi:hypothetical protein P7C70_g8099, partial [Phenoliferia sp. Uapishka_3]